MKKEIKGENVTNKNLVTIKIKQRKEPITGLYVNHDNNWVAVLENTYDYVLDGYTFINREWIDHFHIETDRIADYIFSNSKWELINSTLLFPPALFDKEKLVEIWQHKAHKFWLGEVKNINEQYITMRILDKQAQWIEYKKFPLQKIRFFRVNTRYSCAYQKYITTDSTKIPRLEIWEIKVNNHNEIYKGVVPAKFGGSAVGGAVNIVIKEYPPRYLDASYSFGSFNTHKASSVFKRNLVKQGIELGAALLYTHSDNDYRMELPQNKGKFIKRDHDKFNQSGGGISMKARKWWFDQMEFELEFIRNSKQIQGVVENIRSAESSAGAYNFAIDLQKDNFLLNGLDFSSGTGYAYSQYNFVDTSRLRYDWDMNPYPPVSAYGGEIGVLPSDMKMRKHTVGNKTNLNYIINDRHSINLNSLFKWALGKPSDPLLDKAVGRQINFDSHMTSWVLGLGYDYKSPNDKFLNSLTGKYYYYSMNTKIGDVWNSVPKEVDMQQHDWGVSEALRYRFTKELLGKASVSYDVRLPTDAELIGDGFLIAPSGDLKPERGTNANIGLMYDKKIGSGLLQVEVNGFFSYLQDMIRYTRNFVQGRYTNFGEMRTFGVEAEVKADVTRWLYGYVNATFQDLRDTRKYEPTSNVLNPSKGLRMPNIPYFLANAGVEFHKENLFGGKGQNVRLFTDASFVEEYFFDFEVSQYQEKRIPRSFKLDLGLEYSIMNGGLTFSAKASNLTNARLFSEFNYPLPGRAFTARIRYVLK